MTKEAETPFRSLDDLSAALRETVAVSAIFNCINTRLILQLGINLKKINPEQNRNPEVVRNVTDALVRMGVLPNERSR